MAELKIPAETPAERAALNATLRAANHERVTEGDPHFDWSGLTPSCRECRQPAAPRPHPYVGTTWHCVTVGCRLRS